MGGYSIRIQYLGPNPFFCLFQINYSELARKYCPNQQLGNMVVKEFLSKSNIDLSRFSHFRKNENQTVRRRLKRMFGGETSVPVPRTTDKVKEAILEKIKSGELSVGEMIVPKQYKKLKICEDGSIEEEIFHVSGRKIPLLAIREKILQEHEKNGWLRDKSDEKYQNMSDAQIIERLKSLGEYSAEDDIRREREKLVKIERTRHILCWSDHSCVLNHGHLLLTVNVMYDPAFYLTREEIRAKTGKDIEIETLVQKPEVYIMARCTDQHVDQLCYIDNRLEDIKLLENKIQTTSGVSITDKLRFFHGDHPAQAVEVGQQDGGHYPCCLCPVKASSWTDPIKCYRAPSVTMQQRIDKVCNNN